VTPSPPGTLTLLLVPSVRLERVMHIERAARCMDREMKRHPGVRRDPDPGAAWIPACAGMTTSRRVQYVDTPKYITRSSTVPHVPAPRMTICASAAAATGARHSNHILTASESNFKMLESMGLLDVPCKPFVIAGEGMPAGSVGGEVT